MRRFFEKAASFLDREPELWKENVESVELNRRLLWFLVLRFSVSAALFLLSLFKRLIIPDLSISSASLFVVAAILFVLNVFYWLHYQWAIKYHSFQVYTKLLAWNIHTQIILDFLILGFFVYECGGIESPLIYFFLFHNTLSCLFFRKRVSIIHTFLSIMIILTIYTLTSMEIVRARYFIDPVISGAPVSPAPLASYYLAGVISIYLISWYLVSTITESLKEQEHMLQEKIQEMVDLAREKNRYMLVTTHELKAPFAAIQSYTNVAMAGYAGDISDKLKDVLRKINTRCNTITQMITEMIQLSNITSLKERRQDIVMSRLDLSRETAVVLRRFDELAKTKGAGFDLGNIANEHHYIEASAEQIDILLNNVIKNAVSYCYPDTRIKISISEGEEHVVLAIADRGIGIKKEQLEKVFLEHFRTEKAVEMNPASTGLGLTIARQIMDIHRGRIWIESEEGKGTSVFMEFPKNES